jgi:hypothetical protein
MGFLSFSGMARIMKAKINKSLVVTVKCRRGLNAACPLFALLPQREGTGRT